MPNWTLLPLLPIEHSHSTTFPLWVSLILSVFCHNNNSYINRPQNLFRIINISSTTQTLLLRVLETHNYALIKPNQVEMLSPVQTLSVVESLCNLFSGDSSVKLLTWIFNQQEPSCALKCHS